MHKKLLESSPPSTWSNSLLRHLFGTDDGGLGGCAIELKKGNMLYNLSSRCLSSNPKKMSIIIISENRKNNQNEIKKFGGLR
jgi:hypothetical protein